MDKAHNIQSIAFSGKIMMITVDGKEYSIDLSRQSERLARATQAQRQHVEISPSAYGLHWPDVDEDLSIDGLIGIKHAAPLENALA